MKLRPRGPALITVLGALLVAVGSGFPATARAADLVPDTPCKWSSVVNGLKGRLCLSRTALIGGSTVVQGTLTLRNETRRAITVSRWFESMHYTIVDANGQPVTAGINEGGSAGGSLFEYSSNPEVVPPRGELSIAIPGGGGIMRNKAAVLMLGTWATLYTVEPTDHPPYLHAVLEIEEREVDGRAPPEPRDWFGRLVFQDVQIPLGVETASRSKVTKTLAEAHRMMATKDGDQVRDAVYKLSLLDSLRVVPLYLQAFDIAESVGDSYIQHLVVDGLGWLRQHHPDDDLQEVNAALRKISQPGTTAAQVREQAGEYLQVRVTGQLYDAFHSPVANGRVGIFRDLNPDNAPCPRSAGPEGCLDALFSSGADRAHAITETDGRFTLQVPEGLVLNQDVLWAEGINSIGERVRTVRKIDSSIMQPGQLDNIVLQRVADFTARILHEGQPVAGAQVRFLPADPQPTDATGSVTTHRYLAPGPDIRERVSMVVRADGFATTYQAATFGPGTTTQVLDLTHETVLTGRVIGPAGKPIAQAKLTAFFVPEQVKPTAVLIPDDLLFIFPLNAPAAGTARTNDAGMFTLQGLRAGRSYRLLIEADEPSIAGSERLITAGDGPFEIALNAAVPVTLAISGLRGVWPPEARYAAMNKRIIERALSEPPVMSFSNGPRQTIQVEWFDPGTGAWLPVLSPRKVTVRDTTHADLRFDKVPVGTIRIRSNGGLQTAVQTFDPVTIRAGRSVKVPVQLTALQQVVVKVTNQDGGPVAGYPVEFSREADGQSWLGNTGPEGSFAVMASPMEDLKIKILEAGQVLATATIRPDARRPDTREIHIRIPAQ